MKKLIAFFTTALIFLSLVSCSASSKLYGVWYVDSMDTRNAIQFSENSEGKDVFIWAVYDIENETVESNSKGYYTVSGDSIIFEYSDGTQNFELKYKLDGDELTIYSDTATMVLERFVLDSEK